LDENGQPVHEADDECRDATQHDPEKHREREEDPEEHGQPTSAELVVANDEPDRLLGETLHGRILMQH
jgi:hypothetical protein